MPLDRVCGECRAGRGPRDVRGGCGRAPRVFRSSARTCADRARRIAGAVLRTRQTAECPPGNRCRLWPPWSSSAPPAHSWQVLRLALPVATRRTGGTPAIGRDTAAGSLRGKAKSPFRWW